VDFHKVNFVKEGVNMAEPTMSAGTYIADVLALNGVATAIPAGLGVMVLMGASTGEAVSFGAIAALARSVGDLTGTFVGQYWDLTTTFGDKFDAQDLLFTALATGAVQYAATGLRGEDLYKVMAIGGVAGIVAPMITKQLHEMASGKKT